MKKLSILRFLVLLTGLNQGIFAVESAATAEQSTAMSSRPMGKRRQTMAEYDRHLEQSVRQMVKILDDSSEDLEWKKTELNSLWAEAVQDLRKEIQADLKEEYEKLFSDSNIEGFISERVFFLLMSNPSLQLKMKGLFSLLGSIKDEKGFCPFEDGFYLGGFGFWVDAIQDKEEWEQRFEKLEEIIDSGEMSNYFHLNSLKYMSLNKNKNNEKLQNLFKKDTFISSLLPIISDRVSSEGMRKTLSMIAKEHSLGKDLLFPLKEILESLAHRVPAEEQRHEILSDLFPPSLLQKDKPAIASYLTMINEAAKEAGSEEDIIKAKEKAGPKILNPQSWE